MINDIAQWAAVAIILVVSIVWIAKRLRRRGRECDAAKSDPGCDGCDLADMCRKRH